MVRTRQNRTPGPSGNPRERKQGRSRASRLAENCLEAGFPTEMCCSGCQLFYNIIPVERRFNLKLLLKNKSKTHGSKRYQCRKPWEIDLDSVQDPMIPLIQNQLNSLQLKGNTLFVSDDEEEEQEGDQVEDETEESTSSDSAGSVTTSAEDPSTTGEEAHKIEQTQTIQVEDIIIFSKGTKFVIENVPLTHAVVPKHHLKRLQNKESAVDNLRKQYTRKRFIDVGTKTRATIATALASVPALAIKAAQYFIPTIVASFLFESGLLSYRTFNIAKFAASFPSEHYFRTLMFEQASKCLYSFGLKLQNRLVFLSCDKGNKKGVGHFVKMLSFWDASAKIVEFRCLNPGDRSMK